MKASLDSYHLPVTGRNILRFVFPTIVMTVFNTFYTMVDGLFVSNLIGTAALSAINLTAPAIGLITAVSGMLATGGSAVVMKKMGEGREEEARQDFTLLILTNAVVGAVMMALGYGLMDVLLGSMGLSPEVFGYCHAYLSDYLLFTIPILLMYNFSLYLIAADRSRLSLICTVAGGVSNIVLDYVLIAMAGLGIRGAAAATGLGYSLTAAAGLLVFRKRDSLLHFQKPVFRGGVLFHASANGLSELATSLVSGITTLLFNLAMLKYIGEDGVAAITIIMYVLMFVSALFIGYSYGAAPMISYYHGEGNHEKLKKLVRFSVRFILGASGAGGRLHPAGQPGLRPGGDGEPPVLHRPALPGAERLRQQHVHRPVQRRGFRRSGLLPVLPVHRGLRPASAPAAGGNRGLAGHPGGGAAGSAHVGGAAGKAPKALRLLSRSRRAGRV